MRAADAEGAGRLALRNAQVQRVRRNTELCHDEEQAGDDGQPTVSTYVGADAHEAESSSVCRRSRGARLKNDRMNRMGGMDRIVVWLPNGARVSGLSRAEICHWPHRGRFVHSFTLSILPIL
jgi:hypothetical protein